MPVDRTSDVAQQDRISEGGMPSSRPALRQLPATPPAPPLHPTPAAMAEAALVAVPVAEAQAQRQHWTSNQLHAALQAFVKEGRVQAGAAAAVLHAAHPERLRPRAAAAAAAMRLLDQQAFGLLYLRNPDGADKDALDLRVLWPKAGVEPLRQSDLPSDTDQEAESTESETGASSELTPSSTPEGIAECAEVAARHAAQRALRARRLMRLRPTVAKASGGSKSSAAVAAPKPKAKATAARSASGTKGKAEPPRPLRARGAAAARESREGTHTTWQTFQAEHLPKLKSEGCSGRAAQQAVGKLWLEHQAKALGKKYGCPKCRWETGRKRCGRYPPGRQ